MTVEEFKKTISGNRFPSELSPALLALWYDAKGDWEKAHRTVQDDDSKEAAWIHAYLHRKEGDESNARYWYIRARRPKFDGSLDDEWEQIVVELLKSKD